MEILDNLPVETRNSNGPLRIPILDKMKEGGVIAHGKIESGSIKVGAAFGVAELVYKPIQYYIHERIWYRWIKFGLKPKK